MTASSFPGAPDVTYAPSDLTGDWAFQLTAGGTRQRMRHDDLVALYRACDTALNDERRAAQ